MSRSAIVSVSLAVGGGLIFSIILMRLGTDIESPELLRYILIASLPLTLLLLMVLIQLRPRSALGAALVLGGIMCVPMESVAYVMAEWSLRGRELFERDHLPTLMVFLLIWGAVIALFAWALLAVVHLTSAKRQ